MKRYISLALGLVLVVAACGGGDDAADGGTNATDTGTNATTASGGDATTTTQAPATTGGAIVVSGNFCADADDSDEIIDGIDFLSSDIEGAVNQWIAVIAAFEAEAPDEIAEDVAVIANAARQFAALLEEADYQMINIDPADPRMEAFDDGSIDEATINIAEYCGWDIDVLDDGDDGGGVGGLGEFGTGEFGSDDIPDSVPASIVPPGVLGVNDNGAAGVNLLSSASFDDLLGFFTDVIGEPDSELGTTATFSGTVEGKMVFVILDDLGDQRVVTILILPG